LSFRERYARTSNYIGPILNAIQPVKPVSIGLFGGQLQYGRLKWWAVLFVTLIIQAPAADRRNWQAIRSWAEGLGTSFKLSKREDADSQAIREVGLSGVPKSNGHERRQNIGQDSI
jgi:hypothetical protein